MTEEEKRRHHPAWRRWGPYLADRQWATVREDYSKDGSAWEFFPHDHARSRAYRWGEDGLGGWSDDQQRICLSIALWNGRDPFLKERLFGVTGKEGNHAEDVKELYWYLDAVPSHAFARMLYKYPQAAFPYERLVEENQRRSRTEREFEILDTGIFDDDRYFDVFIEYAKADPDDTLLQIRVFNRGPEAAELTVLPQITLRNTWAWEPGKHRPLVVRTDRNEVRVRHAELPELYGYADDALDLLFCENETNDRAVFGMKDAATDHGKDGFHRAIVDRDPTGLCTGGEGTKAAFLHRLTIDPGASETVRFRLTATQQTAPFADFDELVATRERESDAFYEALPLTSDSAEHRRVQRQAYAGLIWSKQWYYFDVDKWLDGDPLQPKPPAARSDGRNSDWRHLNNSDVLLMPDGWEYPWYAAWDLAFHTVAMAPIDPEFAKEQLILLTREWYMHPNGQFPAYEWAFGDVNPPVHAWAAWRVFRIDRHRVGHGDHSFLERVFHKLLLNFTWWVNRKDHHGNNLFQGGFLGLDNIGVFDRSEGVPGGGYIEQADGTSWMGMYCLNMMRIALELSCKNPVYQDLATKFFEHFLYIAGAMVDIGGEGFSLWDEEDEFFYDVLHVSPGPGQPQSIYPMKLRSIVGLIPLFAVEVLDDDLLRRVPEFRRRMDWFLKNRPDLARLVSRWHEPGRGETHLLSLLRGHRMKCLLRRALDPDEFLSRYGVRSMSRVHRQPYVFEVNGTRHEVTYQPAESDSGLFGGNSNWRGPVWMPINYLLIESLRRFHDYYGDDFKIECPTGSGQFMTILDVVDELTQRLVDLFLPDASGKRPAYGDRAKFRDDPHFNQHVMFHEYFHGETGRGLGAAHQTGWTALVANLLMPIEERTGGGHDPSC